MKLARLAILSLVGALPVAGCVTEGAAPIEPASADEQAQANIALGVGYLREQRADLAIDALQRAIDVLPRSAEAHSLIAIAYDQSESFDLAEEHHQRATQLAPTDADVQNRYAVFLCRQDRWNDAESHFQRAIDASARNARIPLMLNAATCARSDGDPGGAERNFRAVLDLNPVNVDALRGMMDLSIRASNYISGRAFYQRLERATALQADDLLSCYMIERQLGDAPAAAACADRMRREFPGSPLLLRLNELEANAR